MLVCRRKSTRKVLKLMALLALFAAAVPACRVLPEPGFSWLLSRIVTLLDGYGTQVRQLQLLQHSEWCVYARV